jgi:hypothetical protein
MSKMPNNTTPQTKPGTASAEDGMVILDGPGAVAVTMSPDAAAKTGKNLIDAAEIAARQPSIPED